MKSSKSIVVLFLLGLSFLSQKAFSQANQIKIGRERWRSQFSDTIIFKNGQKQLCRLDAIYSKSIYFSKPIPYGIEKAGSPVDSILLIKSCRPRALAVLDSIKAVPFVTYSLENIKRRYSYVDITVFSGYSMMLTKHGSDYFGTNEWAKKVVQQSWESGARVAILSVKGLGGYGWYSNRSCNGTVGQVTGNYIYETFGVGVMYRKHLLDKKVFLFGYLGTGYSTINGNFSGHFDNIPIDPPTLTVRTGDLTFSSLQTNLGVSGQLKIVGPLYGGMNVDAVFGEIIALTNPPKYIYPIWFTPTSNGGKYDDVSRIRFGFLLGVKL